MSNGVNTEIILNSPYYRFNLISILLLGIISFTANYLLIPLYGLTGAAAGSTLSILLFNLLKGGFLWFRLGIQPFNHQTIKALALIGGVYAVGVAMGALVPTPNHSGQGTGTPWALLWNMLWQGTGMLTLFVVALYRWKISPEIVGILDSLLRRVGWPRTTVSTRPVVLVGQQIKGEAVFVSELGVRSRAVGTNPQYVVSGLKETIVMIS